MACISRTKKSSRPAASLGYWEKGGDETSERLSTRLKLVPEGFIRDCDWWFVRQIRRGWRLSGCASGFQVAVVHCHLLFTCRTLLFEGRARSGREGTVATT